MWTFLAIGSSGFSVEGKAFCRIAGSDDISVEVPGVPNKVLQELVCILVLQDDTGGVYDLAEILDELATLGRKLVEVERRMILNIGKTPIELLVGGKTTVAEGFDGAKETNLRDECEN